MTIDVVYKIQRPYMILCANFLPKQTNADSSTRADKPLLETKVPANLGAKLW